MNDRLMQTLVMSKQIMDKHNEIPRQKMGESSQIMESDIMVDQPYVAEPKISQSIRPIAPASTDQILNSRLPEEIKRLMIEKPIIQPEMNGPVLSEDIIKGAARLMGENTQQHNHQSPQRPQRQTQSSSIDLTEIRNIVRDTVRDTVRDVIREELKEMGLMVESTSKTNEILNLRVGSHIFEGKILKIKKIKQ